MYLQGVVQSADSARQVVAVADASAPSHILRRLRGMQRRASRNDRFPYCFKPWKQGNEVKSQQGQRQPTHT